MDYTDGVDALGNSFNKPLNSTWAAPSSLLPCPRQPLRALQDLLLPFLRLNRKSLPLFVLESVSSWTRFTRLAPLLPSEVSGSPRLGRTLGGGSL